MAKQSQKEKRSPAANWKLIILQAAFIALVAMWVYGPALHGDWLWDDDPLIIQNALIHDPDGLWTIWFEPGSLIDYQPLTVSVEWFEWQLWDNDPLGYHLLSVILHIGNALLVWRLLSKMGLRLAWLGGLLFVIHPAMVESVAWISELKNTLSLPLFLLAMCAWLDYDQRGRWKDYFLALALFLVAMLCKASMVMFPLVILLHAWWMRGRIGRNDVKAASPFFAVSVVLGLTTVWFLQHHAMGTDIIPLGGFFSRIALAGLSISFYFSKCVWPVGLFPIYPQWRIDPPSLLQFLPWPILAGTICWLWRKRTSWGRHALLGLGFFLLNLLPFVGFTQGSYMTSTWVMDHFLYIPIIGLIGLAVAALAHVDGQISQPFRLIGIGIIALVVTLLAFESHGYAGIYLNEETLWTYACKGNPDAWTAHDHLGHLFLETGRVSEAIKEYGQTVNLNPDYSHAHTNLGIALSESGRLSEALAQFEAALRLKPDDPQVHNDLGAVLLQNGKIPEAIEQFKQALALYPDYAKAQNNLAMALEKQQALQTPAPRKK